MSENKESNNTGCIVCIALFVIGSLVYTFATESSESIAETGTFFLTIAGLAIVFFVCKFLFSNKSHDSDSSKTYSQKPTSFAQTSQTNSNNKVNKSPWGCILTGLACVVITVIIVTSITSSFSFNYAAGVAIIIILAIVIGIFMYNSFKE